MAKRVVSEYISFTPSTKTITIPNRIIPRKNLMLVTNASSNTVLFNFSDPDLTITSYTVPYSSTGTQFTVNYNTSAMGALDPIMIIEDLPEERTDFAEIYKDPVNKLRVASPESLIDTDFEYGLQPIKWEALALLNNIPSFFLRGGGNSLQLGIGAVTGGNQAPRSTMTVNTLVPHNLSTGDTVNVSYTTNFNAEGSFPVLTVPTTTQFTYTAKGQINGSVSLSSTVIQGGPSYDISGGSSSSFPVHINVSAVVSANEATTAPTTGSVITVTTTGKHGLMPGAPLIIFSANTVSINGTYDVLDVPTATTFRYVTPGTQTGTATPTYGAGIIVPRPEASFVHRSSDGGVMLTTTNVQQGITAIRQTRRYFRYQSGKGLAMSTGTKFVPSYDVNTITSAGTTCTVTVQQQLNIASGVTMVMEGVEVNQGTTNYFNTSTLVTGVSSSRTVLTYTMAGTPADTSPGGQPILSIKNWKGAACRVGMFDQQNGMFYEYDGRTMFAVRRNSVKEAMGTVTVTTGSTTVTGSQTMFHKQLIVGGYVVLRGQSYQVVAIDSSTSMEISPPYRGTTVTGIRMNITTDVKTPQTEWNLDECDGSGPSGYVLDVTKMQMAYIDYSWYGAGFIRFGFRMTNGDVVYAHKVANNNVNNAAYMRSGNLPARYEVTNVGPTTRFISNSTVTPGVSLASSDTSMVVKDAEYWNTSGTIFVQQGANTEVMTYTGITEAPAVGGWRLTGLSRRQFGGGTSNVTFSATEFEGGSGTQQTSVNFITCDCAPTIMHWGTSVIMDGGYKQDRSIQFAYTRSTAITTIAAGTSIAVLSIRLAPSVDNSIGAQFSNREIINRMQLQTQALGLAASTSIQVLGILNAAQFGGTTAPVFPQVWTYTSLVTTIGTGSLAQIIDHTGNTTTVTGGEQIFGFITSTGADNYDISQVRDLGASIISGDGSSRTPGYPNGPDILTIVLKNATAGPAVVSNLRLSWTEAQA